MMRTLNFNNLMAIKSHFATCCTVVANCPKTGRMIPKIFDMFHFYPAFPMMRKHNLGIVPAWSRIECVAMQKWAWSKISHVLSEARSLLGFERRLVVWLLGVSFVCVYIFWPRIWVPLSQAVGSSYKMVMQTLVRCQQPVETFRLKSGTRS